MQSQRAMFKHAGAHEGLLRRPFERIELAWVLGGHKKVSVPHVPLAWEVVVPVWVEAEPRVEEILRGKLIKLAKASVPVVQALEIAVERPKVPSPRVERQYGDANIDPVIDARNGAA